jgi:hypothetical protein
MFKLPTDNFTLVINPIPHAASLTELWDVGVRESVPTTNRFKAPVTDDNKFGPVLSVGLIKKALNHPAVGFFSKFVYVIVYFFNVLHKNGTASKGWAHASNGVFIYEYGKRFFVWGVIASDSWVEVHSVKYLPLRVIKLHGRKLTELYPDDAVALMALSDRRVPEPSNVSSEYSKQELTGTVNKSTSLPAEPLASFKICPLESQIIR